MTERDNEELILKGERFDVYRMQLLGDDGKTYPREVMRHPGAVVLLPLLDDHHVVLIENTRATVGETLLELPAGTREANESVEKTAHRELTEETGFRAGNLQLIHQFYSAPGICDELMHLYLATDLVQGQHQREATEKIVNRVAGREEIRSLISEGKIRDAKTLVGLYVFLSRQDFQ